MTRTSDRRTPSGDTEVLVVGAGPTGLTTAVELLRRRVAVRIVERDPEPFDAPRALSLWPRALDIIDDLGELDRVLEASVRIDAFRYFSDGHDIARFGFREDLASRTLPQATTERILTDRLTALSGKVERGVRLTGLDASNGAAGPVEAVLEHADGTREHCRVPYLVGADGATSAVREQLGIEFRGSTYEMAFTLVDTRIVGELPGNEIRYYQSPQGTLIIVPQPAGVFRFLSVAPATGTDERDDLLATMQGIVDERGPAGVRLVDPVWRTIFRVHARRAVEFRRGRVFLAGDAAHVHSPAGGQGMNNGLQDANNLGWKLAAVLRGESPPALLDGYGPERTEATVRITRDTDLQTRAWMAGSRARVLARDAAFRLLDRSGLVANYYTPVMAGRRLAYRPARETQRPARPCRWPLPVGGIPVGAVVPREAAVRHGVSGPTADPSSWSLVLVTGRTADLGVDAMARMGASRPTVRVVAMTTTEARAALGCGRPGYHLVRPDGHLAAHGHASDLDRLETELGHAVIANPVHDEAEDAPEPHPAGARPPSTRTEGKVR